MSKLFSRVRLKRDVPAAALRALLVPAAASRRAVTTHQLLWTLFADDDARKRDFLWREHSPGFFYILSDSAPRDQHSLFDISPPKEFDPHFRNGDMLDFELRVNATVSRGGKPGIRGKPSDIVMDALFRIAREERAEARNEILPVVARDWMTRQGSRNGFEVQSLCVQSYEQLIVDRGRARPAKFGVLDVKGMLSVGEASEFIARVEQGFGRAKAFGCGLMMLRRA